jgi:hypothetical protein
MMSFCFHLTIVTLYKTQKRAIARFLMFQVDPIDAQRDSLSVHTNNHKEKVKFIPQYNHITTVAHTQGLGDIRWSGQRDLNSRHQAWEACTLPTELCPLDNRLN